MLLQKTDKIYLAAIAVCGVLEALFIILQMYQISIIANAVFLEDVAVQLLYTEFIRLAICMLAAILCGYIGKWIADSLAFLLKKVRHPYCWKKWTV